MTIDVPNEAVKAGYKALVALREDDTLGGRISADLDAQTVLKAAMDSLETAIRGEVAAELLRAAAREQRTDYRIVMFCDADRVVRGKT